VPSKVKVWKVFWLGNEPIIVPPFTFAGHVQVGVVEEPGKIGPG
jgi:hypothetical protein